MIRGTVRWAAMVGLLGVCCGCPTMGTPRWADPGTEREQQQRAMQFDPYPMADSGVDFAGGRPREFDRPRVDPRPQRPW